VIDHRWTEAVIAQEGVAAAKNQMRFGVNQFNHWSP
jgi:hypothetical protein